MMAALPEWRGRICVCLGEYRRGENGSHLRRTTPSVCELKLASTSATGAPGSRGRLSYWTRTPKAPSRGSWIREGLEKHRTKTEGVFFTSTTSPQKNDASGGRPMVAPTVAPRGLSLMEVPPQTTVGATPGAWLQRSPAPARGKGIPGWWACPCPDQRCCRKSAPGR